MQLLLFGGLVFVGPSLYRASKLVGPQLLLLGNRPISLGDPVPNARLPAYRQINHPIRQIIILCFTTLVR